MKAKEVLKVLGVTRQTLYNYLKQGKITVKAKFNKNFYEYDDDSVYALIGKKVEKNDRKIVSYSRVSTQSQKDQLKEQSHRIYDSCVSRGIVLDEQLEDIKSGISSDRGDFQRLIRMVIKGEVELVVIENKDRLVRFGYNILEQIFKYFGTKILVLNDVLENKTYDCELEDDFKTIIQYFCNKSSSIRKKFNNFQNSLVNNTK